MSINRGCEPSERDYRTKCSKWIANNHFILPPNEEPHRSQHLHASESKKPKMNSATKRNEFDRPGRNADQNVDDEYDFFGPFSDYENDSKYERNKMHMLKDTQMSTKRKNDTQEVLEKVHQKSQARSNEKRHADKRSRADDDKKIDFDGIDYDPFDFDFPSATQNHSKKRKIDKDFDSIDFAGVENAFNDKRNDNLRTKESNRRRKQPPDLYKLDESKQLIFKRMKERSYEEFLETPSHFPVPKDRHVQPFKESERKRYEDRTSRKASSDNMHRAMERYQHSNTQYHDKSKHEVAQQMGLPAFGAQKSMQAIQKIFGNQSTPQPIICNIKCNNLIIKTD